MFSKKTLVIISLVLAIVNHFIFYFVSYAPFLSESLFSISGLFGMVSSLILIFVYFATNWRYDLKGSLILQIFDLMILLIFITYLRSTLNIYRTFTWQELLLSPIVGLSLFPPLFFIVGLNIKYFSQINKMLLMYCIMAFVVSLLFLNYNELQFFLLLPLFYIIVTFPIQSKRDRILTFLFSVTIIFTSISNRAGILRILISYFIVGFYYLIIKIGVSKKIVNVIVLCVLFLPFYFLYLGTKGQNVFEIVLGENVEGKYGQENIKADTRTFLYVDVFRDLKINKAFAFGKGINAAYLSYDFQTFNRTTVEVGFLQILLKSGIIGFILYITIIISAIFKALSHSNSIFLKYLGMLLTGYILMFFIENIIAFNLLNIVIWLAVGMCHSREIRDLNDKEIRDLLLNGKALETQK